ncbi:NrfD/PsrC family molybdoenzyme membrane anchor subunit [Roseospirillum parvum]|uniref:Prokaryotic molybdopterin-containing oxidoreductase family, membrane subunit n=1 Tax=Roseospirillum parvum TaxID=83401 RepID=A0A1G7W1G1_9PROT|nr:NrfD/PsrC family molybdoenzyme membrane anchor subunit [Roseospirillum parvum]SDG65884.1 prokaryotic molybdopterin-containing oxidoreductase family, membrane subunit [Roseospirillum parvum]
MPHAVPYRPLNGHARGFWLVLGLLGLAIAGGLGAAHLMHHEGHIITGMTNQVVWGLPHVFAVFLIVAASGALNVASIGAVFERPLYKPLARLSALLAMALLIGGLSVLVLDLGRPDRLTVAMTHYNFKSIFAWNIFLYTGFLVLVGAYLWAMIDRAGARVYKPAAYGAFVWRLVLTTGTGAIFGFLVARQAYDAAILAPLFIAMSLVYGKAIFVLFLMAVCRASGRPLGGVVLRRLQRLMGIVLGAMLYFVAVHHLTNLYASEHHGIEAFLLRDGGPLTTLFWGGHVLLGGLVPLYLLLAPRLGGNRRALSAAAVLLILGGLTQVYGLIIGGQSAPLVLFPGFEVSSAFADGVVASYVPSPWEVLLGLAGVAIGLVVAVVGCAALPILPADLSDAAIDPDHVADTLDEQDGALAGTT